MPSHSSATLTFIYKCLFTDLLPFLLLKEIPYGWERLRDFLCNSIFPGKGITVVYTVVWWSKEETQANFSIKHLDQVERCGGLHPFLKTTNLPFLRSKCRHPLKDRGIQFSSLFVCLLGVGGRTWLSAFSKAELSFLITLKYITDHSIFSLKKLIDVYDKFVHYLCKRVGSIPSSFS